MGKITRAAHTVIIAIWPVTSLILLGYANIKITAIAARTYNPLLHYWLAASCVIAGFLFAMLGLSGKEPQAQKGLVYAHVAAAVLVLILIVLWILVWTGGVPYPSYTLNILDAIFGRNLFFLVMFIFGYTVYTAAKAAAAHKK